MKRIPIVSGFLILLIILTILGRLAYFQRYSLLRYLPSSPAENYLYHDDYLVHKETGKLFSGRQHYGKDGSVEIFSYKNGLLHGITARYKNGKIVGSGYYKNGKPEGLYKTYYENGKIEYIENYREDGELESWERYDENGQLVEEKLYPTIEF